MAKTIGIILLCFLLAIAFIQPLRDYMNALFHHDEFREENAIGTVSTYNPRVREIQMILTDAGYYDDVQDGLMGEKTRMALKTFQQAHGVKVTGYIDSQTLLAINRIEKREFSPVVSSQEQSSPTVIILPAPVTLRPPPASPPPVPEEAPPPEQPRQKSAPETLQKGLQSTIPGTEDSHDWSKKVQSALKKAGLYNGSVDGKIGTRTKKAIKEFQSANGLKPDGVVGKETWEKLRKCLE